MIINIRKVSAASMLRLLSYMSYIDTFVINSILSTLGKWAGILFLLCYKDNSKNTILYFLNYLWLILKKWCSSSLSIKLELLNHFSDLGCFFLTHSPCFIKQNTHILLCTFLLLNRFLCFIMPLKYYWDSTERKTVVSS